MSRSRRAASRGTGRRILRTRRETDLKVLNRTDRLVPTARVAYHPTQTPRVSGRAAPPTAMRDAETIKRRIAELQLEHRGLDAMIDAIGQQPGFDELQLRRLKKRKLQIKDSILLLQMQLVPDIPA